VNVRLLRLTRVVAAAALGSLAVACSDSNNSVGPPALTSPFVVNNLVADAAGGPPNTDANLVNPWGIAFGPSGTLWVANNGTGTSTLYDTAGVKGTLVVTIPTATATTGGKPTGVTYNATTDFKSGTSATPFLFAGEDGVISAWSAGATVAAKMADRSANGSVYKGIAIAANNGANFLYATDFKNNAVDMFDATFTYVKSFTDATVPAGYAPFGIQTIGGALFVSYAKQLAPANVDDQPGGGFGYVVVFNPDGTVNKRFASNGNLDAPWGMAQAPAGFGDFSGAILIGNFGDGRIGAYNATTGAFMGYVTTDGTDALIIDGLWGLAFGVGTNASKLFFSAGPGGEAHGLVGVVTVKP
jgi:uncharacterized protein (TIGR03118 family)